MTHFRLVLPGVTPAEVAAMARHDGGLDVRVTGDEVRARVVVERSTQPELRGRLSACPGGTLVEGRLGYARPLAYLLAYGAMTLATTVFAGYLAQRGEWAAFAMVAAGALLLLLVTWLSLHAGVAHKADDAEWLEAELARIFDPSHRRGTLEA